MAAPTVQTIARFLEGDFWELKQKFRSRIDNNDLFELRYVHVLIFANLVVKLIILCS